MKRWLGLGLMALALATASHDAAMAVGAGPSGGDAQGLRMVVAAKGCKYKMDGVGNCLSPAFYKCQRDWTACVKACKANTACQEKCEVKYAAQCGD